MRIVSESIFRELCARGGLLAHWTSNKHRSRTNPYTTKNENQVTAVIDCDVLGAKPVDPTARDVPKQLFCIVFEVPLVVVAVRAP